jgi:hypothetical protein
MSQNLESWPTLKIAGLKWYRSVTARMMEYSRQHASQDKWESHPRSSLSPLILAMLQHWLHLLSNVPEFMHGCVLCFFFPLFCFTNQLSWSLPRCVLFQHHELGTQGIGRGLLPFGGR